MDKVVELERAMEVDGQLGSFGFSIMGGYGTKFPSCVCEVDSGGPADRTNKVRVGDRLLQLNGEELDKMTSRDVVQRIRHAPSPSTFVLSEDEELRMQILAVLRKKERRAVEKARRDRMASTGSEESGGVAEQTPPTKNRRKTPPVLVNEGAWGSSTELDKKKKRLDKIIEVEPSVNITNGQAAAIVQVRHNKIVGRLEEESNTTTSSSSTTRSLPRNVATERLSPLRVSPGRDRGHRSASNSPKRSHKHSLSNETPPSSTPLSTNQSTPNISLDSLSTHSSNSSHGGVTSSADPNLLSVSSKSEEGLEGDEGRQLSDYSSSGVNSVGGTPHSGSVASFEEKIKSEDRSSEDQEGELPPEGEGRLIGPGIEMLPDDVEGDRLRRVPPEEGDSGVVVGEVRRIPVGTTVHIPEHNGLLQSRMDKSRSSLNEDILIGELERGELAEIDPSAGGSSAGDQGEEDEMPREESGVNSPAAVARSDSLNKLIRRRSSKRKDEYTNAVMMARRLFMLDGFKKSEVAAKLADRTEFGRSVAKEYLKFFEFQGLSLEDCLRQFLTCFSLTGETQERERVIVHFSERYHECNPQAYRSSDEVHGIIIALLLLNTDLHNQHSGKKMTLSQFGSNLETIDIKLHKSTVKMLYDDIRKKPLEWAIDDADRSPPSSTQYSDQSKTDSTEEIKRVYHVTIPGTFVEVEMSEDAPLFKEGYVLRKNIMDGPHRKVTRGKRQWRPFYAYLKGFLLYLERPRGGDLHLENTSSAISVCHCLAMGAYDYHKKNSVLRVTTSEWQSFLLQANDTMDMQQWITAINKAAATYSASPLAAPVSSSTVFQRPTYPMAPSKNDLEHQIQSHDSKVKSISKELEEHHAYKPKGSKAKHADLKNWFDKFEFLQFEFNRFQIYSASLTSNLPVEFNAPLPSGLVPSPSISTLATPGSNEMASWKSRSITPPHSPPSRNKLGHRSPTKRVSQGGSPLLSSRGQHS